MKKLLLIIIITSLFSEESLISKQDSPCANSELIRLQKIQLDEMTENEFRNFIVLSNDCTISNNYISLHDSLDNKINNVELRKSIVEPWPWIFWILVLHNNLFKE